MSELLQFLKRDSDLALLAGDYETPLVKLIQQCFKHFCQCVLRELLLWLPALLDGSHEADSEDAYVSHDDDSCDMEPDIIHIGRSARQQQDGCYPTIGRILMTLSSTMQLLKRYHVNPGLNIQIFSILFRAICVNVFNQLVVTPGYCQQSWGVRLRQRLARIETWAERQGLERTTNCQLCMVVQVSMCVRVFVLPMHMCEHVFVSVSTNNACHKKCIAVMCVGCFNPTIIGYVTWFCLLCCVTEVH